MFKPLLNVKISPIQKITFSGLLIAVVIILQKILAINYIPVVPFLRISLGGPALIIFSSLFLGPIYGLFIGAASDVLGYFIFDPKANAFFPQITAIYAVLGLVSYFVFLLFKLIKNKTLMLIIEGATFIGLLVFITLYLCLNTNLQLYSSTYEVQLWQKIVIPIVLFILLSLLFISSIIFDKKSEKWNLVLSPINISFSCFVIEVTVMVMFGTLMKGFAFGFATYPMILLTQIIVLFINVPLNTWLLILLFRVTNRFYNKPETFYN